MNETTETKKANEGVDTTKDDPAAHEAADNLSVAVPKDKRKMSNEAFAKGLEDFKANLFATKRTAHHLAVAAATHFKEHGDTIRLQQLLDCFEKEGKNFVRVAAFKMWMRDTLPITMDAETGKLIKRPDADLKDEKTWARYEEAMEKPFWNWAPDKENILWEVDEVVKELKKVVNRYGTNERYIPKSDKDKEAFLKVEKAVNAL